MKYLHTKGRPCHALQQENTVDCMLLHLRWSLRYYRDEKAGTRLNTKGSSLVGWWSVVKQANGVAKGQTNYWRPQWGLNSRPLPYEGKALPPCYGGFDVWLTNISLLVIWGVHTCFGECQSRKFTGCTKNSKCRSYMGVRRHKSDFFATCHYFTISYSIQKWVRAISKGTSTEDISMTYWSRRQPARQCRW